MELLGADVARIASEIEKLSLYAGTERRITEEDIFSLAPSAKASTIFSLVNALGRNDRPDRSNRWMCWCAKANIFPSRLSFLATQFRLAFVAKEARLSSASQIQAYFSETGNADVEIAGGAGRANRRSVLGGEAADSGDQNL